MTPGTGRVPRKAQFSTIVIAAMTNKTRERSVCLGMIEFREISRWLLRFNGQCPHAITRYYRQNETNAPERHDSHPNPAAAAKDKSVSSGTDILFWWLWHIDKEL